MTRTFRYKKRLNFIAIILILFTLFIVSASKNMFSSSKEIVEKNVFAKQVPINNSSGNNSNKLLKKSVDTNTKSKKVYLTFDDGPSPSVTPLILDALDKLNIKATFFVIGSLCEQYPDIVKDTINRGHTVSNHTYSHNYSKIYSSTTSFLNDVEKADIVLKDILGDKFKSKALRMPGGGYGNKFKKYREVIKKNNYNYVYWDVETGDARVSKPSEDFLIKNTQKNLSLDWVSKKDSIVVLMHDASTKKTTASSLPQIVELLKSKGYNDFVTFD